MSQNHDASARAGKVGIRLTLLVIPALLVGAGCNYKPADSSAPPPILAIIGTYHDYFCTPFSAPCLAGTVTITAAQWSDSFSDVWHILTFDNDNQFLIASNDMHNTYNPSLYSRFDWTSLQGTLYYCQTAYNAPDAATAQAAQADRSNPSVHGCNTLNDFPWDALVP